MVAIKKVLAVLGLLGVLLQAAGVLDMVSAAAAPLHTVTRALEVK